MPDVRLIHGDCLDILPTLEAGSVDAVVTDPPYGTGQHLREDGEILKTRESWDVWNLRWLSYWDGPFAMFCPPKRLIEAMEHSERLLARVSANPIALKGVSPRYGIQYIAARGPFPTNYGLDWLKHRSNIKSYFHPHEKPIEVMEWLVNTMAPEGATILDPFMGSGTTGVACVNRGYNFIGIEIDRDYFEIAEKRITQAQQQMRLPLEAANA